MCLNFWGQSGFIQFRFKIKQQKQTSKQKNVGAKELSQAVKFEPQNPEYQQAIL